LELHPVVGVAFALELDAVEAGDEVDVPPVAAELAVGDRGQAKVLLQLHHLADQPVLGLRELRRRGFAEADLLAQLVQLVRPEQAADVLGAERPGHLRRSPCCASPRGRWSAPAWRRAPG